MSEQYRMDKTVDPELLNKPRGAYPIYPGELQELIGRLGGSTHLKRRHGKIGLDMETIKKNYARDLLEDRRGDSEVALLKRVILILISEIEQLKGV